MKHILTVLADDSFTSPVPEEKPSSALFTMQLVQ